MEAPASHAINIGGEAGNGSESNRESVDEIGEIKLERSCDQCFDHGIMLVCGGAAW